LLCNAFIEGDKVQFRKIEVLRKKNKPKFFTFHFSLFTLPEGGTLCAPRYISPENARSIIKQLPPFVERVGLFVNEEAETIDAICRAVGISLAQIHFDADNAFLNSVDTKPLPVVRARKREDVHLYAERYRLVDAYCEAYGGSGKRLNLEWFEGVDCSRIILAGGLTPENVEEIKPFKSI